MGHDGNHAAGCAVSGAVRGGVPEAGGFVFASRFTCDSCVAIFELAFGALRASGIAELVRRREFLKALGDYGAVLTAVSEVMQTYVLDSSFLARRVPERQVV